MSIANKISGYNRKRKYEYFKNNFIITPETKILDVGFANQEYSPVDNYLEKSYPFLDKITALGVDGKDMFEKKYPEVYAVIYGGDIFPFKDKYFDIGWSNAVIEHVGKREKKVQFLKEMLRTCNIVYFTTPNIYFPVELHIRILLLHWLPKPMFDGILNSIGKIGLQEIICIYCQEMEIKDI